MKKLSILAVLLLCAAAMGQTDTPAPSKYSRNNKPAPNAQRIKPSTRGAGLAPTTWGFASHYQGTLYGTGYYPFRVDLTYAGTNSIYGYTFNYPTFGFVNDIRAIYAFDVSSLFVGVPSPAWSSFMFDVREQPANGGTGLSAFANMALTGSGQNFDLTGMSLFQGGHAANLDVYDAEDFENATPFADVAPAFTGNNTLIGTIPVSSNTVTPISIDVSNAVLGDVQLAEVPTLSTYGVIAMISLLAGLGVVLIRRNRI